MSHRRAPRPAAKGGDSGFLGRWHRRKGQTSKGRNTPLDTATPAADPRPDQSATNGSDNQGPGVPEGWSLEILRNLFLEPEFSALDGLNEYDEDYTGFVARGNLIPREMQRSLERRLKNTQRPQETDRSWENDAARQRPELESSASGPTGITDSGENSSGDQT